MNIFITKQIKKYIQRNNEEKSFIEYLKDLSPYSFDVAKSLNKFDIKKIQNVPIFDYKGGSRLYCVEVNTDSKIYERIKNCINLSEDTVIFIELHPSSAHERQNEIAQIIHQSDLFQIVSYDFIMDNCKEKDISEQLFLFLKNGNCFETLLTLNQQEAIIKKEYDTNPMLITGIAGSGKTEIGIQYIERIIQKEQSSEQKSNILCVTYNNNLLKVIKKRINKQDEENPNIKFYTIDGLLNYILNKYEKRKDKLIFDDINNFIDFKNKIINREIRRFHNNYNKICSVFNKYDNYILYSEIYGLIFGSMLLNNDRDIKQEFNQITKEHYFSSIPQDYSVVDNNDKDLIYDISCEYINFLEANNISTYNSKCLQSISYISDEDKFDKVVVDEVQDLTECEIYLLLNLAKNINGMFFAGDINQVINPTFFDFKRISVLLYNKFNKSQLLPKYFSENFRNSKCISEIAYFLNSERKQLFYSKKSDEMEEKPINYTDNGNVYYLNNSIDELKEYIQKDSLTVVIAPNQYICEKLKEKFSIGVFETVENFKGMEADTVILYNLLTENKKEFDEMYDKDKNQNNIYKYIFNKFYVGVTRAINSLIFVEDFPSLELSNKIKEISENITTKDEINIIISGHFEDFVKEGKKFMEQKLYDDAYIRFSQAEKSKEYKNNDITKEQKEDFIKVQTLCNILKDKDTSYLQKAELLEKEKFYNEAIEFYEKTNGNYAKIAINYLLLGKVDKWEQYLIKSEDENINVENYDTEIAYFLDDMFQEMQKGESLIKTNSNQFKKYTKEIRI